MISLYLLSLLMISIFNYRYYDCYCTLCYMYLQVIQINIIIIIIRRESPPEAQEVLLSILHHRAPTHKSKAKP